jgi:hypothetical protein
MAPKFHLPAEGPAPLGRVGCSAGGNKKEEAISLIGLFKMPHPVGAVVQTGHAGCGRFAVNNMKFFIHGSKGLCEKEQGNPEESGAPRQNKLKACATL